MSPPMERCSAAAEAPSQPPLRPCNWLTRPPSRPWWRPVPIKPCCSSPKAGEPSGQPVRPSGVEIRAGTAGGRTGRRWHRRRFRRPDAPYYLLVTAGGFIKRIPAKTIENARAEGIVCCRVPENDGIIAVVAHGEDDEILIAKAQGKVLRIETGAKLRPVPSASAGTVSGVKLDPGDRVVDATTVHGNSLLCVHSTGMALAVALDEYPVKGRGTGGVQSVLTDRPAKTPAGELALITCQSPGSTVTGFTGRGTIFHVSESDNPLLRRATNSRGLLTLGPGDTPMGWATPQWGGRIGHR